MKKKFDSKKKWDRNFDNINIKNIKVEKPVQQAKFGEQYISSIYYPSHITNIYYFYYFSSFHNYLSVVYNNNEI